MVAADDIVTARLLYERGSAAVEIAKTYDPNLHSAGMNPMLAENWYRRVNAMGEAANLLASLSKQSCWLLLSILGVGTAALPAVADNPPPIVFHNEEREAPVYYYHMMAAAASAMAQGIPQPSPLPSGSISVTASSVNGVPHTVTHTKTGSGTYARATASSTPGATASAFASVSVTHFDVP